jgi:hypothetical protein
MINNTTLKAIIFKLVKNFYDFNSENLYSIVVNKLESKNS